MSFADGVEYGPLRVRETGKIAKRVVKDKIIRYRGRYRAIADAWGDVVGAEISAVARPVSCQNGKLMIKVSSPILLHELKGFMKQSILEELNRTKGGEDISDLCFIAG